VAIEMSNGIRDSQTQTARRLLSDLKDVLTKHEERSWLPGFEAAIKELDRGDEGFGDARSIYKTMVAGGRGLSEVYIWRENELERRRENEVIDRQIGRASCRERVS
jgi:hypothetical protein